MPLRQSFCLLPEAVLRFQEGVKSGVINPLKLSQMSSAERRAFLGKFVGEGNAQEVNALFESKLLLQNQKAGLVAWARSVAGLKPEVRRDLIDRIQKLDRVLDPEEQDQFLADLAEAKLGFGVSKDEASKIVTLTKEMSELKAKIPADSPRGSAERLSFGWKQVELENLVNDLKLRSRAVSIREQPLKYLGGAIKATPGALKSLVASLDNSFYGRQGVKVLFDPRTTGIWVKGWLNSWKDIGRELGGKNALDVIKADIYSRPNAVSGKYKAGRFGLDVLSEEAYPSSAPERLPVFGRLFKASQAAFNGGALRLRADLADRMIAEGEKAGLNMLDPKQAQPIGYVVSGMTGRGRLGKGEVLAKEANVLLFSIKFAKSNLDTLTAHIFDSEVRNNPVARKAAATNLLAITATMGGLMTLAEMLSPGSVDLDPRSSNFGKIKVFGTPVDISGGMGSLVTLASRLVPTVHNGELGFWYKDKNGGFKNLFDAKYGQANALDIFEGWWEGKLSPVAGIVRDIWKGETFGGEKVSVASLLANQQPILKQNYEDLLKDPDNSNIVGSLILDALGFGVSPKRPTNWQNSTSKTLLQFKEKVGEEQFAEANAEYNRRYEEWLQKTKDSPTYQLLSPEDQQSALSRAKDKIQGEVLKSYGFKYKEEKSNPLIKSLVGN